MAPLSLKVVQDDGAVTRTVKVDSKASVDTALDVIKEKFMIADDGKAYGLFLTSADCDRSGVWLEGFRNVEYYMLRDGDTLLLLCKARNLRLRMLDGSVKTLQVDESQPISQMMSYICAKIGITNHEEYGLCYDNVEEETESKATSTGTLTLKRAPPPREKEKDAKLQHMSKKFKTDDNVQWLEMHRTLRELEVGVGETLLLQRRLFYSDRNVDARDPVQLNLLFVQTRDAVLQGRHPVTLDQACVFAGIQCQILYGDYQEDKHKSGYIDYKELLPSNLWSKLGLEKKILREYKKHQGLSSLDAKFLYTKTARDMPTYGVTFFVVKEKQPKGKKKLVPRLLGISANAILRLDEETKEILQAWPLTQVKSYQVGKSHTFTLNFGDYSDKEYSVKTNDAVRIRDILQGYIDIIARRMAGAAAGGMADGAAIEEDSVHVSKGTYMQHVQNNPSKVVQESFVGPTKIIAYQPGQTISQGTQLVTASTLVVTQQVKQQQYQTSGQVPLRKEMSLEFVKKLNRMNSNSVKVVNLITSDDGPHTAELKNIVSTMENDMPLIEAGVTEILNKDMDAAAKKRLQSELQELSGWLKALAQHVNGADPGSDASLEAASKIADLSTQMYLGLDPITKRRSNLVRLSRQSFIADEQLQADLHRASFLSAAAGACSAVDNASMLINQAYEGPALTPSQVEDLEQAARDKLRKLNGAVALFLAAHADPENIDYSAAITSMNTINELILELAKDSQALASSIDGASKQELIDDINKLCDATRLVCSLTGGTDSQKMQDVTSVYVPVADKLIFTFGRGRRDDDDKRIINLAKAVGEKTSLVLVKANELTGLVPHSAAAQELDDAGVQCAGAASDLLACAMLTSPCIHEPHCQSALTASAEALSTAAQRLLVAAKPLLDQQSMRKHGDELKDRSMELAKALDALKNAYGNDIDVAGSAAQERKRLKFIMRLGDTRKGIDDAEKELNKPTPPSRHGASPVIAAMLEKNLAQRMAEYNSAVAALLVATSDRDNPNYEAAEVALNTINELMPGIVKDTKALAAGKDEATRQVMLADLRMLCEATRGICASAGSNNIEDLNFSAADLANASNKLYFTFNPSAPADTEKEILDIATEACTKASQMLASVCQLAEQSGGPVGQRLDASGAKMADEAKALLTCAQLTAACIESPACQASLIQAADVLSASASAVADNCSDMQSPLAGALRNEQRELENELEKLRRACRSSRGHGEGSSKYKDMQRLKFAKCMSAAKAGLASIQDELNKPYDGIPPKGEAATLRQHQLTQSLAKLNAAMAALTAATSDLDSPNYEAANEALTTIDVTMPLVVKESKALSSAMADSDRTALLQDLRQLCDATRGLCDTAHRDPEKLQQFAKEFSASSGKLVFVFNPHAKPVAANQIMKQAYEACKTADQIVRDSLRLSEQLPASGDTAEKVRQHAGKTKTTADSLMMTAQLTAASVDDPYCQSALLSSVNALSLSAKQLAQQWTPHAHADELLVMKLDSGHKSLQSQLENMKREYQKKPGHAGKSLDEESQRLQYVKTAAAARRGVLGVEKELDQPYTGNLPKAELAICRHQLSDAMARLNAAVAALTAAMADPDHPDYLVADEAMATISEIMPLVVKDTKAMASTKDEQSRDAMLSELRALCDATRHICDGEIDPQQLRESAKKFGAASGKLVFALNPHSKPANPDKVKKQIDSACDASKQLVSGSTQLAAQLADPARQKLHRAGNRTEDSADALLTTAQLTSPSLEDPRCQAALLSAVDALSLSAHQLAQQWAPVQDQDKRGLVVKLDKDHGALQLRLEAVRKECQGDESDIRPATEQQQRVRFADSVAVAKGGLRDIELALSKPFTANVPKEETKALRQRNLSAGLARLNAALAALAAATADPENVDYAAADEAMGTIHEILPLVVKDTQAMAAEQNDVTKVVMLDSARALCKATRGVCDTAEQNPAALRDFAKKFAAASGKLVYVVNARAKPPTANQVIEATQAASKTASRLCKVAFYLAEQLGPAGACAGRVSAQAHRVVNEADALVTAAQLTAPCIGDPHCQSSLSSSIDKLSSSAQELNRHWSPLAEEPILFPTIRELEKKHQKLTSELGVLKSFCQDSKKGKADNGEVDGQRMKEAQKNQYIAKAAAAKEALKIAERELDKPVVGPPAKGEAAALQLQQLSQRLAKLHAALLALSIATSDNNKPDYVSAENAIDTIRELMPHVVKNTNSLLSSSDSASQAMSASELRALFRGAAEVCDSAERQDSAKLNDQLTKNVIPRLGKLYYVVHPNVGTAKLGKVEACAKSSCSKASQLLTHVFQLAEGADAAAGRRLDGSGAAAADAAKALLTAVQLTGPYIHQAEAQCTLISVADTLASSANDVAAVWRPLLKDPKHKEIGEKLEKDLEELKVELEGFRKACKELEPENIVHKTGKPKPPPPPRKPADEEKKLFSVALEKVGSGLQAAEAHIKKVYNVKLDAPQMHKDQVRGVQKALESKIALSNVATSALLACNATEPVDYASAAKHSTELANLLPKIAQDAKVLSNTMSEKEKKAFLGDILAMFDATKKVIESAQSDRKNLNGAAVEYGDRSGALLYSLSTDVDPSHEKEVIAKTKVIGDCVSQITMSSVQVLSDLNPETANRMCAAGKQCATAAGNLVYTAKLVAPSIQIAECQDILKSAAQAVSTAVKAFSSSWQPLNADPEKKAAIQEFNEKTAKVEGLLEELRVDLQSGRLVKVRPSQKLLVEDTPLRRLAAALAQNAMKKSSNPSTPLEQKRALVEYARALTDASEQVDRANAICKKEPHDLDKSRELELAVQNLQVLALQSRPSANQRQQYIVDLTEFVKELSREADQMLSTVASCSVKHKEIDAACQAITAEAERIAHPSNDMNRGDGTTADDIYEVDRFAKHTEARVKKICSQIQILPECTDKDMLNTQSVNLEDSCNILRFATQSALATTQSATLDMTLHDLTELETRIDGMLHTGDNPGRCVDEPIPWLVHANLLQAARNVASQPQLCAALTQYIHEQRAWTDLADPKANQRLKEHVRKLSLLLRTLLVQTGRRAATWQGLDGPEVAALTEQVLREIEAGCSFNQPKEQGRSVLQNIDLNRLLLSTDVITIDGDRNHVEDKLQQTASKLASLMSTVLAGAGQGEAPVRSLAAAADAAGEAAALARALKIPDDPLHNAKVEEAARETTFQTYNVLKASELVSQEPHHPPCRRRLLDACRLLDDALNNLGRAAAPGSTLQRECRELSRRLQLQHAALQARPACALPYRDCLHALNNQLEVIQKLNSDEPMSREEFARTLGYISSAVCNSAELAAQCGYLMSLPERDQVATEVGVVDARQLRKVAEVAQATCYRVLQFDTEQAKEESSHLIHQTQEICEALADAEKKSQHLKEELRSAAVALDQSSKHLHRELEGLTDRAKISAAITQLLDSIKTVTALADHPALVPALGNVTAEAQQRSEHVLSAARELTNKTASLVRDVKGQSGAGDDGPLTWVTFSLRRRDVLKAFEALLASVRENGQRAGILEVEAEEEAPKSYVQLQVDLANKWLKQPNCKPEAKASGVDAAKKVIDIAEQMVVDMKESEKEDMCALITETKELLGECSKKCTPDKASLLVERLKALKKAIERGVVTLVVEDLMEGEEPLQDLETLADSETDECKRKFLLERKIAELLAQLGRVSRAARAVGCAGAGGQRAHLEINKCTEQANLLAPLLVKAAQERINLPDNKAAIENYKSLLAQYAESLSKVRELCDQSVDPMEFVQTAGETMQRMREESSHDNDPQKCVYTSTAITKLANRVIQVSMSSPNAKRDPELRKALSEAQQRLQAAVPGPQTRHSRMPDWKDTTAEILRTTGEVEAVMGGENIFQNQPQSDQPIFAAARELHSAVREWSARDNEIVGVAKKMAVLMAKLSAYMNTNAQHELIVTSKSIVSNAHEVAELARKLAHECTDVRIKTNLLQVCDRIPTISGQLKMLTTVKGSTLTRQGHKEDQESLTMLVDNAQNLMLSIQQVVKAAAGASVKIAAQRGGVRVRWVRKAFY